MIGFDANQTPGVVQCNRFPVSPSELGSALGASSPTPITERPFAPQAAIEFGCMRGKHTGYRVDVEMLPAWVRFGRHSGNEALHEAELTSDYISASATFAPLTFGLR